MEILKNVLTLIVLVSGFGIWYFIKKSPNKRNRNISIAVLIGSLLIIGTFSSENTTKNEITKPVTTQAVTSSESTENTKEEKTSETKSETTTTQEIKNDGPKYTEASNTEFSIHLTTEINNQLANTGYQVLTKPVGNSLIYLYLPQEAKYYSKVEIQQIADKIYQIKESTFKNWAIENGYDLGSTNSPKLYVKVEDDTTIAEESGIFNKTMKVKVNN
ncbi:hypothetical protein QM847_01520 [Streptococcus timonensis]|uniref:hypothetical protein n=1 Tax=Streptococcus timonensis TaxID=1852387 RepID=UPI0039C2E843